MRYSNLHNHSNFSDGKHTPEENVLSAIEKNMLSLGFSDHSYTACDPSYCMWEDKYDAYKQEINRLKQKYAQQIPVYLGMELDYYSTPVDRSEYDYILASVHYIVRNGVCYPIDHSPQQQKDCAAEVFGGDYVAMAKCYFDMLCEHVERTDPTFVGHFDVITKFSLMPEEDERYRKVAKEALARAIAACPYIEMNTGAISRGWRKTPYPCSYLLDTVKQQGGHILLSADSHHKDNLTYYFDESVQLLRENGFDHIAVFNGKDFDLVGI